MNPIKGSFIAVLFFPVLTIFASEPDPPMKWGVIPPDDLAMTSYAADSNANAVILCDYGDMGFDFEYNPQFSRHVRIKILKQAGYDIATHSIYYYGEDGTQRVRDIEGVTYAPGPDGTIKKTELDDESIFDESSSDGWKRIKFTMPALSPGCIVEFRYTIKSTNPQYVPDWNFQTSEPTRWSEFRFKCPDVYGYGIVWQGYEQFFIKEESRSKQSFGVGGTFQFETISSYRWVLKNAPAIREEAYMTTTDDYTTKVVFQLNGVAFPGYVRQSFMNTWEKLTEELMDHRRFGKQLRGFSDVRKKAESVTQGLQGEQEKMEAVYDFVRSTIVWNERRRFLVTGDTDLDDVLESKSGSSADINLLLVSMLREAGLQAEPVILSTRGNGRVQRLYPIYSQFDYVIARATVNGKHMLLDATDRLRPHTLLPRRALNHAGWVLVSKTKHEWMEIVPPEKVRTATTVQATLHGDGSVSGNVERTFSGYTAFDQRTRLMEDKEKKYIENLFETETSGIAVDTFTIEPRDSIKLPLKVTATISAPAYAQVLNEFIYVNPMLVARYTDNPLKLAKRNYPVDIANGVESSYSLTLTIPDGYTVKEKPRDLGVALPVNGAKYSRKFEVAGNTLQMHVKYELNQLVFESKQYGSLKGFFDYRVQSEAEQVVLEKKPEPAAVQQSGKKTSAGKQKN